MYIDYETYASLSASPIASEDFPASEAWAEALLDHWTLNRLQSVDWSEWTSKVQLVMARLIDSRKSIEADTDSGPLTHFSNGQDSYTFESYGDPLFNAALGKCYGLAVDVLPVELISACVRYNGAS